MQKEKSPREETIFLVTQPLEWWNQIMEELKQLYVLQLEEKREPVFVR